MPRSRATSSDGSRFAFLDVLGVQLAAVEAVDVAEHAAETPNRGRFRQFWMWCAGLREMTRPSAVVSGSFSRSRRGAMRSGGTS